MSHGRRHRRGLARHVDLPTFPPIDEGVARQIMEWLEGIADPVGRVPMFAYEPLALEVGMSIDDLVLALLRLVELRRLSMRMYSDRCDYSDLEPLGWQINRKEPSR